MNRRWYLYLFALLSVFLLIFPAAAQDGRAGTIIEGNPNGAAGIGPINPILCNNPACMRMVDLLFPTLLAVDPALAQFIPADSDSRALVTGWEVDGDSIIYTLRDDLSWSDGTPITAYDVFFTYEAMASQYAASPYSIAVNRHIAGAVPLDDHRIAFTYNNPGCDAPNHTQMHIAPAHAFAPGFNTAAKAFFNADDRLAQQHADWKQSERYRNLNHLTGPILYTAPTITAGDFVLDEIQPTDYIRLKSGGLGFEYRDIPSEVARTDLFINGVLNLLVNPPYNRYADVYATPDVQIAEYPGTSWNTIIFNLAGGSSSKPAFDEDGERIDQGQHPILGDVRVRRAIQMALDVDALIEAAVEGHGTPMASSQLPGSWAYNDALTPLPYDPAGAARLLQEAGWIDTNSDGIRECIRCALAEEGRMMSLQMRYIDSPQNTIMSSYIAQQLRRIGIALDLYNTDQISTTDWLQNQDFSMTLVNWQESYPVDPHQPQFTSAGDVLGSGGFNYGSYYNPQVDALMEEARTLPGCDQGERAALYRQIQAILQEDQPYVWLFAPHEMVAARGGVLGFDPYPNAPFWNIESWRVVE